MRSRNLLLGLAILPLTGCDIQIKSHFGGSGVLGTGPQKKESRPASGFTGIKIEKAIQATVVVDGQESVEIDAKESLLPLITTNVSAGVLTLTTTKDIESSTPVKATIHLKSLDRLDLNGASEAKISQLRVEKLALDLGGASSATILGDAEDLNVVANGASHLVLKGKSTTATIHASGASTVDLTEAAITNLDANACGASRVKAGKVETLSAEAFGASTIAYQGDPKILKKKEEGASSVSGR